MQRHRQLGQLHIRLRPLESVARSVAVTSDVEDSSGGQVFVDLNTMSVAYSQITFIGNKADPESQHGDSEVYGGLGRDIQLSLHEIPEFD